MGASRRGNVLLTGNTLLLGAAGCPDSRQRTQQSNISSCIPPISAPLHRIKFERSQLRATLRWAWRYRVHFTLCFTLGAFRALTGALCFCDCQNLDAHKFLFQKRFVCTLLAGNPLLLFYAPELFQTLGTSQNYSLLSAVTQGCAKVIGTLPLLSPGAVGGGDVLGNGAVVMACCVSCAQMVPGEARS